MHSRIGQRIMIVGVSGSGKTTLACALADRFQLPHIELDRLFWQTDWQQTPDDEFEQKIQDALSLAGESWVICGNYRRTMTITWPIADTLIWLDYPRHLVYWRIFWRTVKRIITREKLWQGNRESFRKAFLSRDSILLWVWKTYPKRRQRYNAIIANNEFPNLQVLVFYHPHETDHWLKHLKRKPHEI